MNLFSWEELPDEELMSVLAESTSVRIERIVSCGQTTDWYDQEQSEFVALLQGEARLQFEDGREITLSRGDTLVIEPHERHRVSFTSKEPPCVWLCVFY